LLDPRDVGVDSRLDTTYLTTIELPAMLEELPLIVTMLASEHFGIKRTASDDWFDPILDADTELFVDPFLVFKEKRGFWRDAHSRLIAHFDLAFLMIAKGNLASDSLSYKKALRLLVFREPRELCLGYTSTGTAGLGSGSGYAEAIGSAIAEAIKRGLQHPRHFEELGILNEGIGPDRISDITCTILKARLVQYTQSIAQRHRIPVAKHNIFAADFDKTRQRWGVSTVEVPTNPSTGGPLLFVPERFLKDLPVLNADDWWTHYESEQLRQDLNYEILGKVDKKTIVEAARRNPESVRRWTTEKEASPASGYDLQRDAKGVWQWDQASASFVRDNPLVLEQAQTREQFLDTIRQIVHNYGLFVEEQGGWYLLWDSTSKKEKPEHAAQLLFRGVAHSYCKANDISLDPEVNLGRGPVDFKFSQGYRRRAHLEVKKLHNGKFWNGLSKQLPSYMKSDEVCDGWLLAVRYRDNKSSSNRAKELPNKVDALRQAQHIELTYALIDARPKKSASKL
jgi:hypothetical protein